MFLFDKKFYLANIVGVVSLTPGVEAGWTPGKQVVEGGAPTRPNNQKKAPLNRSVQWARKVYAAAAEK